MQKGLREKKVRVVTGQLLGSTGLAGGWDELGEPRGGESWRT